MSPITVPHESLERANRKTLMVEVMDMADLRDLPRLIAIFVKHMESHPEADAEQLWEQFALQEAGNDTKMAYRLGRTLGKDVGVFRNLEAKNIDLGIQYSSDGKGSRLDPNVEAALKKDIEAILGEGRVKDILPSRTKAPVINQNPNGIVIDETRGKLPAWVAGTRSNGGVE